MDGAVRLLSVMKRQAQKENTESIQLGTIGKDKILQLSGLKIEHGDYSVNVDVNVEEGDTVVCCKVEEECIVLCKV